MTAIETSVSTTVKPLRSFGLGDGDIVFHSIPAVVVVVGLNPIIPTRGRVVDLHRPDVLFVHVRHRVERRSQRDRRTGIVDQRLVDLQRYRYKGFIHFHNRGVLLRCGGSQVINQRCWRRSLCKNIAGCQDDKQSEERRAKSEERRASI